MAKKPNVPQAAQSDLQAAADAEQEAVHAQASDAHSNLAEGSAPPADAPAPSKFAFKKVKSVALPLFKLVASVPRYFLVDGPIYVGKKVDDKKEPALLLPVTDLETGEQGQVIVGAVLKGLILEGYPDGSYVGRKFEIKLLPKTDKKYNTYGVLEIETE